MYRYLVSVDPSLTCSGWAVFGVGANRLISVGTIKGEPASKPLAERLSLLQLRVMALFSQIGLSNQDVLVCESPTTMRDPSAAIKVEQVRGIFEAAARLMQVEVPGRINPRSVQYEIMGLKGKQLERHLVKALAVETVRRCYAEEIKSLGLGSDEESLSKRQDIVDAILLGQLAVSRLQSALNAELPLSEVFSEKTHRGRSRKSFRMRAA